jgi:hypothetical protein
MPPQPGGIEPNRDASARSCTQPVDKAVDGAVETSYAQGINNGCPVDEKRILKTWPKGLVLRAAEAVEISHHCRREPPSGRPGERRKGRATGADGGILTPVAPGSQRSPSNRMTRAARQAGPLHLIHGGAPLLLRHASQAKPAINFARSHPKLPVSAAPDVLPDGLSHWRLHWLACLAGI